MGRGKYAWKFHILCKNVKEVHASSLIIIQLIISANISHYSHLVRTGTTRIYIASLQYAFQILLK